MKPSITEVYRALHEQENDLNYLLTCKKSPPTPINNKNILGVRTCSLSPYTALDLQAKIA
jgi:hypothetical protein